MSLRRWLMLVGTLVLWGTLQVTWRNALVMKSYAVGERLEHEQATQTRVRQLTAKVESLESPTHLAAISSQRKLGLVAWSILPPGAAAPMRLATVEERE